MPTDTTPRVYKVVRYYRDPETPSKKVKGKLTITEAREYCRRPDTRGPLECPTHGRAKDQGAEYCRICGVELVPTWFCGFTTNE